MQTSPSTHRALARGGSGHGQTWDTPSQGVRDTGEGGERAAPGGGGGGTPVRAQLSSSTPAPWTNGARYLPHGWSPGLRGSCPQGRCHHPRSPLTTTWMSFLPRRHLIPPSQGLVVMATSPLPLLDPSLRLRLLCPHPLASLFLRWCFCSDSVSISVSPSH